MLRAVSLRSDLRSILLTLVNKSGKSTEYKINSSSNNVLQPDINGNKSGSFLTTWREY